MTRFWDLRFRWSRIRLVKALRTGIHRFEPVEIFRKAPDSDWLEKWSAIDSVFLKAISLSHGPTLHEAVSSRCFHLQGRGESKGAVASFTPLSPPDITSLSFAAVFSTTTRA